MQREVGEPNRPAQITASQWRHIVNGATDTANISTDKTAEARRPEGCMEALTSA